MRKISLNVPEEWIVKKRAAGMTWEGIMRRGFDFMDFEPKYRAIDEEYKVIKQKQQRTAELLQHYVQKYNDIINKDAEINNSSP